MCMLRDGRREGEGRRNSQQTRGGRRERRRSENIGEKEKRKNRSIHAFVLRSLIIYAILVTSSGFHGVGDSEDEWIVILKYGIFEPFVS